MSSMDIFLGKLSEENTHKLNLVINEQWVANISIVEKVHSQWIRTS